MEDKTLELLWRHGATAVARQMGVPVTTVFAWIKRGRVPSWRERDLLEALAALEKK